MDSIFTTAETTHKDLLQHSNTLLSSSYTSATAGTAGTLDTQIQIGPFQIDQNQFMQDNHIVPNPNVNRAHIFILFRVFLSVFKFALLNSVNAFHQRLWNLFFLFLLRIKKAYGFFFLIFFRIKDLFLRIVQNTHYLKSFGNKYFQFERNSFFIENFCFKFISLNMNLNLPVIKLVFNLIAI
jgi:hypothetical protein